MVNALIWSTGLDSLCQLTPSIPIPSLNLPRLKLTMQVQSKQTIKQTNKQFLILYQYWSTMHCIFFYIIYFEGISIFLICKTKGNFTDSFIEFVLLTQEHDAYDFVSFDLG